MAAELTLIASLPMYDLAGLEAQTDALWADCRDALRGQGIAAPDAVTRGEELARVWCDPGLVLSQTCGLPLVTGRAGAPTVLGAFDYGLPGCAPGQYNSVIVACDPDVLSREDLTYAFNERGSQSGYAALCRHMEQRLAQGVETGSHLASLRAVADGRADIAALDAVTWRLAPNVLPDAAASVVVVDHTPPTPGLPLISAGGQDPTPYRAALAKAAARIASTDNPLGIRGFVPFDLADYRAAIHPVD